MIEALKKLYRDLRSAVKQVYSDGRSAVVLVVTEVRSLLTLVWRNKAKLFLWITAGIGVVFLFQAGFLYWRHSYFKDLLHNSGGLDDSWSDVGAWAITIVYALVIPYALGWVLFGNWKRKIQGAFAAFFVLAIAPALHGLLDRNFTLKGDCQKYYVWHQDSQITLSDSPGFDPDIGQPRRCITPEVAEILERMKLGIVAKHIQEDPRQVAFFDPVTGHAKVWYYRDKDGHINLYDAEGFSPIDGSVLAPITSGVVKELLKAAAKREADAEAQRKAEEAKREQEAREQAEEEKTRAAAEAAADARVAEEARLASLGVTLSWIDGSQPSIAVMSVRDDSVLAGKLVMGDTILRVNHHDLQRGGDPREALYAALNADGRLDLIVDRGGATYSVAYKPRQF